MRFSILEPGRPHHRYSAAFACSIGAMLSMSASAQFAGFDNVIWHTTNATNFAQRASVAADLNNDGRTDFVLAATNPAEVCVMLARPDGDFDVLPFLVPEVIDINVVDLDDDGVLDLVVLMATSLIGANDEVRMFKGAGDGTFAPMGSIELTNGALQFQVADLDHDDDLDIALCDLQGFIRIYRNIGAAQYVMSGVLSCPSPIQIAAQDVTGDGFCDLIVARLQEDQFALVIFRNSGDGVFVQDGVHPVGDLPAEMYPIDVNDDGRIDIVTCNGDDVSILIADGAGGFLPEIRVTPPGNANMSATRDAAIADFDGDGRLDLAVLKNLFVGTAETDSFIYVYRRTASGDFTLSTTQSYPTERIASLEVLDANDDFAPDLALIHHGAKIGVAHNLTPLSAPGAFSLVSPPNGVENLALPGVVSQWPGAAARLDWSDSAAFHVTYDVHIKRLGPDEQIIHSVLGLTESHYDIPAAVLQPGTRYQWTVRARNSIATAGPSPFPIFEFTTESPADLTGDGEVNGADLATLLSNWGLVQP